MAAPGRQATLRLHRAELLWQVCRLPRHASSGYVAAMSCTAAQLHGADCTLLRCRAFLDWTLQPTHRRGDMTTDMPFPAYPPGMYHAIASMAEIGLPAYITETGICDHTTLKRPAFFRAYLDEVRFLLLPKMRNMVKKAVLSRWCMHN